MISQSLCEICISKILYDRSEIWQAPGSGAADVPVKFQSDAIIYTTNLTALRHHKTSHQQVKDDRSPKYLAKLFASAYMASLGILD